MAKAKAGNDRQGSGADRQGSGKGPGSSRTRAAPVADRATSPLAATSAGAQKGRPGPPDSTRERMSGKAYLSALAPLQVELCKLQEWVRARGLKVVVIFEGRDAAGKGGAIKTISLGLNPRIARVVALPAPTERERTQWYFQRYVPHLPAAGEIVLFDRSWYNRAGVDRVMGFASEAEVQEFFRSCPEFERMLVRSGIVLVKYWFSVSDAEQERRFQARIRDPTKRWKLSPMDLQSRARWVEYSMAKDDMFRHTDIKQAPWYVVNADDKRRARLNMITHLLSLIPYEDLTPEPMVLPPREPEGRYVRPPMDEQTFIPEVY
jgi:polyphosphate kinase 2